MFHKILSLIVFCSILVPAQSNIKLGCDLLLSDYSNLIDSKNLGLIVNHTSLLSSHVHLADSLHSFNKTRVQALFAPEHGIRGDYSAGETVSNGNDAATGIPIYSLYGKSKKPTKEMLKDIDLLIFDIQDIGVRFYTYISTLYFCIEAAIENNIPIIVLDRPNPISGLNVDGPIIKNQYISFVGIAPLPVMHGMTVGEIALYFNDLFRDSIEQSADLTVIQMENWEREYYFDDCNLAWVNPSPNIAGLNTAIVYPGMCLLEGTNISEGRGTGSPFLTFGAPFINSSLLLEELRRLQPEGINFELTEFVPQKIQGTAPFPKFENEKCYGLRLIVTDRKLFQPVRFGVTLLTALHKLYPGSFEFNNSWIDKLFGDSYLRKMILSGESSHDIISKWERELNNFIQIRNKYLLY